MVTHLLGWPGQLSARSSSSMAPFFFFNFFTKESTAFSAHFSSSSPCFQPSSLFTAGLVKEKRELMGVLGCIGGRARAPAPGKEEETFQSSQGPGQVSGKYLSADVMDTSLPFLLEAVGTDSNWEVG